MILKQLYLVLKCIAIAIKLQVITSVYTTVFRSHLVDPKSPWLSSSTHPGLVFRLLVSFVSKGREKENVHKFREIYLYIKTSTVTRGTQIALWHELMCVYWKLYSSLWRITSIRVTCICKWNKGKIILYWKHCGSVLSFQVQVQFANHLLPLLFHQHF